MTFLYDTINLEIVVVLFFFFVNYLRLGTLKSFLIAFHLIAIFLLNDVLFDSSYWSDQHRYLGVTKSLRQTLISLEGFFSIEDVSRIMVPSYIFALSPIPFIDSVRSIAMINFLIYLCTFLILRKKKMSSNSIDFFFILYPSFLLYSSLALRDTLIVLLMILVLYFVIIEKKRLHALILLFSLAIIKIQNFLILILSYFIYSLLKNGSIIRYLIFLGAGLILIFQGDNFPAINYLFERIDYYRYNLIAENFGYNWDFMADYNYQPFEVGFSMIPLVIKSCLYMLFKPFPWEATNLVQFLQSVENIVITTLIICLLLTKVRTPIIKQKILFLNIFLFLAMIVYGLVTFNFGTAARFRFPFVVVYFVYYLYLLKSDKIISRQFPQIMYPDARYN